MTQNQNSVRFLKIAADIKPVELTAFIREFASVMTILVSSNLTLTDVDNLPSNLWNSRVTMGVTALFKEGPTLSADLEKCN